MLPLGHELEAEWLRAVSPSRFLRTVSLPNGVSNGFKESSERLKEISNVEHGMQNMEGKVRIS